MENNLKYFLLSGLLLATNCFADGHNWYIQANGGAAFAPSDQSASLVSFGTNRFVATRKEDYDTGYLLSLAVGFRFNDYFRLETEGVYQSNNRDKQTLTSTFLPQGVTSLPIAGDRERAAFLLNGYVDFKNSTAFTPFVTVGLGGYHVRLKQQFTAENGVDFAWQTGAGLNYSFCEDLSVDVKYRYFSGADADFGDGVPYQVGDHQAMAGVRFGF